MLSFEHLLQTRSQDLFLPLAFAAKAVDHDVPVFDLPPCREAIGKSRLVKGGPFKIDDLFAPPADEMMMRGVAHLVAGMAFGRLDLVDKSVPVQGAERAVDRIQRHGRKFHQEAPVKLLYRRMIPALRQFTKNLQPLRRKPQAGTPAGILESSKFVVCVFHQSEALHC